MGIQRLQNSQSSTPNKGKVLRRLSDKIYSPETNTWTSILSITGKGTLHRISLSNGGVSESSYFGVRVIVDGVTSSFIPNGGKPGLGNDGNYGRGTIIDIINHISFDNSLQIQVWASNNITWTGHSLYYEVDYSLA